MTAAQAAKLKTQSAALAAFASNPKVIAAVQKAGADAALYRKAKADPAAYLQALNMPVPASATMALIRKRIPGGTSLGFKLCITWAGKQYCFEVSW